MSDKTRGKAVVSSCGTRIGPDGTVSRVMGPAKENNYALESLDRYIVSGTGELKREFPFIWKYDTGSGIVSSPAVVNGMVYVGSEYTYSFYALNAGTGALVWMYSSFLNSFTPSAAIANGVVYVGTRGDFGGILVALSASTGTLIWHDFTVSIYASLAVANGVVYVPGTDSQVYAFNTASGAQLWDSGALKENYGYSSPTVVNGMVYIGAADGLYAFHLPGQ